jgi:hypothetical protein
MHPSASRIPVDAGKVTFDAGLLLWFRILELIVAGIVLLFKSSPALGGIEKNKE